MNSPHDDLNIDSINIVILKARHSQDKESEAEYSRELGLLFLTVAHNYESASHYIIRSQEIEDTLRRPAEQVMNHLANARLLEELYDYNSAADQIEAALDISRSFNDTTALGYMLIELARIKMLQEDSSNPLEDLTLVLQLKHGFASPQVEPNALFQLGEYYANQGKFDEALDYHRRALEIWRSLKDKNNEARSLSQIGELYRKNKNHDKALANHIVALRIREQLKDGEQLGKSFIEIGRIYFLQQDYQRSIANLRLGLDALRNTKSPELRATAYEYLGLCFKETGDHRRAHEAWQEYAQILDFMQRDKMAALVLRMQSGFSLQKKEMSIRELNFLKRERELELAAEKRVNNILYLLIGFGIIILLLVVYLYLIKRRANVSLQAANTRVQVQNVQLQNLNATKDKFFSIISHDLKGPLNSFTAFSSMLINHTSELSKEEIQMLAKEIDKNLKNLLALLENLLEWARSQTGSIEFKPELFDISVLAEQNRELLAQQAQNKKIELAVVSCGTAMVNAHKNSINTVIRNLVSNAIKFTPAEGKITIETSFKGNDVLVSVTDTGVGMDESTLQKLFRIDTKYSTQGTANEKGTGLGLILCKDFVEKNGGSIGVNSTVGVGSTFYFTLPVAVPQP